MSATKEDVLMVVGQYLASLETRIAKLEGAPKPAAADTAAPKCFACGAFLNDGKVCPRGHTLSNTGLSRLCQDLKKHQIHVPLVELAGWPEMRHLIIKAWLEQGAKSEDRPEFLPAPKQLDLIAALKTSVASATKQP